MKRMPLRIRQGMRTTFVSLGLMLAFINLAQAQWLANPPFGLYYNTHPVGIGTNMPNARLSVESDGDEDILRLANPGQSVMLVDTIGHMGLGLHPRQGIIRPDMHLHMRVRGTDGLFIQGNNMGDAQLRIGQRWEGGGIDHYLFDDKSDFHHLKLQSERALAFLTRGANERMRIDGDGLVGIGTSNPAYQLDVRGDRIRLKENETNHWVAFRTDGIAVDLGFGNTNLYVTPQNEGEKIFLDPFEKSGVTIGTTDLPDGYSLAVDGSVICEGLSVLMSSDWPDYVFEEGYELRSLAELEAFIEENGHLPNVPPANTIKEHGLDVAEVQLKMMEKIEELTLYILQQEQRIQELEASLSDHP